MNVNLIILLYSRRCGITSFVSVSSLSLVTWTTFIPLCSVMNIPRYSMLQLIKLIVSETGRGEPVFLFLLTKTINVVCAHHQFHPNEYLIVTASLDENVKVWGISGKQLVNLPF